MPPSELSMPRGGLGPHTDSLCPCPACPHRRAAHPQVRQKHEDIEMLERAVVYNLDHKPKTVSARAYVCGTPWCWYLRQWPTRCWFAHHGVRLSARAAPAIASTASG